MAETELQGLVELSKQIEEMRFTSEKLAEDCARQFEEQKLRNQNLEVQMQELKTILVNMLMNQRPPSSPLNASIPGDSSSQGRNRLSPSTDSECAHHVLEEMPHSTNTIEVVQIDKSSEDGGEALFEVVNRIERDEDPSQILVPNEPNSAKEPSVLVAHQVLDEMSEPKECSDSTAHLVLEGMTRIIDESVVLEFEFESAPVSSVGELDDSRSFKVSDLKDATSLLLFKNEFTHFLSLLNEMSAQEEIRMNYREVSCFDPGGGFLDLVGDSFKFEIVPLESSNLGCDEELTKRNTEKVEFVPKVENYGDCLPLFYPTNGQIFEVISVCAGMLNFDPGGNKLQHSDDAICLSNEIYESEAGEDRESAEIEKNEPVVVKDPLNLVARNVTRAFASPAFTYVFAALVVVVNTKSPRIGDLLLRRIVLQLIRAYKRNDKPQLVAAAKFIAHLVNQMVCHELIALELLEILLAQPTDDSVEVVGFVTECGAVLQDLSPMGPSVKKLYVQGKEINGAGINSSFATMYAHWVASLTLAEFWIIQIYGFVFDPGGEVAGVLCEKSSVDCDLSSYWCLSSAEWVQAAELVQVQVQAAAIICHVPLPQLIEDKIVYIYETLSTQVGDMGLRGKWAYVDPVYFVALSETLDLIITSNIFIFDPGGQCSRFTETGSFVSCLLWLSNQSYELIIKSSSQEQYFCLILGDKDHLKEGVLIREKESFD